MSRPLQSSRMNEADSAGRHVPDAHELHEIDRLLRSLPRVEPSAATLARTRKAIAAAPSSRWHFFASIGLVAAGAAALVVVTTSGARVTSVTSGDGVPGPVAVADAGYLTGGGFALFGDNGVASPSRLEARVEGLPADGSLPLELRSVEHAPQPAREAPPVAEVLRDAAAKPALARDKLLTSLANDAWTEDDRALLEGFAEALRDPSKAPDVVWSMRLAAALRAVR